MVGFFQRYVNLKDTRHQLGDDDLWQQCQTLQAEGQQLMYDLQQFRHWRWQAKVAKWRGDLFRYLSERFPADVSFSIHAMDLYILAFRLLSMLWLLSSIV